MPASGDCTSAAPPQPRSVRPSSSCGAGRAAPSARPAPDARGPGDELAQPVRRASALVHDFIAARRPGSAASPEAAGASALPQAELADTSAALRWQRVGWSCWSRPRAPVARTRSSVAECRCSRQAISSLVRLPAATAPPAHRWSWSTPPWPGRCRHAAGPAAPRRGDPTPAVVSRRVLRSTLSRRRWTATATTHDSSDARHPEPARAAARSSSGNPVPYCQLVKAAEQSAAAATPASADYPGEICVHRPA